MAITTSDLMEKILESQGPGPDDDRSFDEYDRRLDEVPLVFDPGDGDPVRVIERVEWDPIAKALVLSTE